MPENIRLNSTNSFIMKFPNKQELQQIVINHSSDIAFKDFMSLYKRCAEKLYPFLVVGATLAPDNPTISKKNLLERI